MAITKYIKGECQHCGGHLEFQADQVGLVADCPHCSQATELLLARPREEPAVPRSSLIWSVIALIILGLGLAGSLVALRMAQRRMGPRRSPPQVATSAPSEATMPTDPLAQQGFSASPVQLEKALGTSLVYATGVLKNTEARQRFGVKIELALADAEGKQVGTATDYQQVLEPGGEWKFRALVVDGKATSAKILVVKEDQ